MNLVNQTPFINLTQPNSRFTEVVADVSYCKFANIFPHQNSEMINLPKFYPAKILLYSIRNGQPYHSTVGKIPTFCFLYKIIPYSSKLSRQKTFMFLNGITKKIFTNIQSHKARMKKYPQLHESFYHEIFILEQNSRNRESFLPRKFGAIRQYQCIHAVVSYRCYPNQASQLSPSLSIMQEIGMFKYS